MTYGSAASASGTLAISDALNNGDVLPNTLPADNATTGYVAVVYISISNPGATTISFGKQIAR